jgi:hypothetical protein
MQATNEGLHLRAPLQIRLISLLIAIAGYVTIFVFLQDSTLALSIIFWTFVQIRGLFYAPEMTIYPDGIETSRFGFRRFTHWRDIASVRVGNYICQIYPKNIHPIIKYLLYSYLMIIFWRSNYKAGIAIIENNVEQTKIPQRVSE